MALLGCPNVNEVKRDAFAKDSEIPSWWSWGPVLQFCNLQYLSVLNFIQTQEYCSPRIAELQDRPRSANSRILWNPHRSGLEGRSCNSAICVTCLF